MDAITGLIASILQGILDSLKGITVVFYLDKEVRKRNSEKSPIGASTSQSTMSNKESARMAAAGGDQKESNVLKRVLQCCALNGGVFWLSIGFFEYVLLPGIQFLFTDLLLRNSALGGTVWQWTRPLLKVLFGFIWILPLFVLSKIVNSLWFQDIADSAYKIRKGRPQLIPSISKLVADVLMSLLVQALFLGQSSLVRLLPFEYFSRAFSMVHLCLLYSLYSFEYKWFNMGWELHKRLTFIEYNWPYFLGFGLPLAVLTELPNSYIVSGCVFSIVFPLFILSGNEASPKPNTHCEYPLKLFSPVIAISNTLFSRSIKPRPSTQTTNRANFTPQSTPSSTPRSTPVPSASPTQHHNANLMAHRTRSSRM